MSARERAGSALRELLRERGRADRDARRPRRPPDARTAGAPAEPGARRRRRARAREGRREEYELLVEAIYEGYLLHYGAPRVVRAPEADLRLLAGDQLYAIGLARLVALGDTLAVAELADTITLSALAQGAGEPAARRRGVGGRARARSDGAPATSTRRAKELVFAGRAGSDRGDAHKRRGPPAPR